jgi:LmbE family N-acetylglucosaminyl deacetylase
MQQNKNSSRRFKTWSGYAKKLTQKRFFSPTYAVFALVVLTATTIFWAILSTKIQSSNADQLVNSYLFSSPSNLSNSLFPANHSLLMKWPLFWLISLVGLSSSTLVVFTVAIVLITVLALAGVIYSIERRPLVFGTICLALASCLMLVPAQPYAGGLLPVNMAMLATRNLEYVFYVGCIFLLVRSTRFRSPSFWLAGILLGVLVATDKLFFTLSLGGALIALVVYSLAKGWSLVSITVRWVIAGLLAGVTSLAIISVLDNKFTHLVLGSGAGPYALVRNLHDLALGGIYAILGVLTNFGANPAFHTTGLRNIPHDAIAQLLGISGLSFLINAAIFIFVLFAAGRLIAASLVHNKKGEVVFANSAKASVMLIWSSLAAVIVFAAANHYYAGDARYLTITFFALFISFASYSSQKNWSSGNLLLLGLLATAAIALGIPTTIRIYNAERRAMSPIDTRNTLVTHALKNHPVNVLVGDYWRVMPTKLASGNKLSVLPLGSCVQPRDALSSQAWQTDLNNHSFAYLLTLNGSLTDFPNCKLDQVVSAYGRPDASVLIAGSFSSPKEMLLFYDHGINKSTQTNNSKSSDTVLPITLEGIPSPECSVPTIMNIVAHEDDDLLFMNPDLMHDIKDGHCIRTLYVTSGDAGGGNLYWLGREMGSEAAYSSMIGTNEAWIQRTVKLNDHVFITIANPSRNNNISLIFLHLPDGNIKGQGFKASNHESLAKLDSGGLEKVQSTDGQSEYTSDELIATLSTLMHTYQPAEIRTQANFIDMTHPDHSDHMAVGRFTKKAYTQYEEKQFENRVNIPIKFYIGYPIHDLPENVTGDDLAQKENAFMAYSRFDQRVCQSMLRCAKDPAYGFYLPRQYQNEY